MSATTATRTLTAAERDELKRHERMSARAVNRAIRRSRATNNWSDVTCRKAHCRAYGVPLVDGHCQRHNTPAPW